MENKEKAYVVGAQDPSITAISDAIKSTGQEVVAVGSIDDIPEQETERGIEFTISAGIRFPGAAYSSTGYCPGRHTYVKIGSEWRCGNCGRTL